MREFIFACTLGFGDFFKFVKTAGRLKRQFLVLQFLLITLILYLPLFYSIIIAEPYELYSRLYSISFQTDISLKDLGISLESLDDEIVIAPKEDMPGVWIKKSFENSELNSLSKKETWFCFSNDYVLIHAGSSQLVVFMEGYSRERASNMGFGTVFNDVSVNNGYYTSLLFPILALLFVTLVILQMFFYLVLTVLLKAYRMTSSPMSFWLRFRILLMASASPALLSMLIGFAVPALHIIIFELLSILLCVFISTKYDKKEKELFLCEEL
ncbi:hypothetical protein [Lachnoclostridium phytofermentans]|uniref:hypothetical protein n=1 Tax=Lachnoclostridium phytofermentans TaxID=66219 RepID=UPI00030DBD88|nr:hypothetical protein [Lachnoclostridium phytofermentans]